MMSLATILDENKNYLILLPTNRIKCLLTGHELPPKADAVSQYMNSKSFKKSLEWYSVDYSEYLPHIVQDKENKYKLYCKITKQVINKIPHEVKKHVNGKKFIRLKIEYEKNELKKSQKNAKTNKTKCNDEDEDDFWKLEESEEEADDDDDDDQIIEADYREDIDEVQEIKHKDKKSKKSN